TEPPYGCLGPSGNDRYRKRSPTMGRFASQLPSRGGSFVANRATIRRVRAGAIGGFTAMTRTPRVPRVCWLGSWALGTSDRGGQDKSRKVRPVGRDGEHREIPAIKQTLHQVSRTLRLSTMRYGHSSFNTL